MTDLPLEPPAPPIERNPVVCDCDICGQYIRAHDRIVELNRGRNLRPLYIHEDCTLRRIGTLADAIRRLSLDVSQCKAIEIMEDI